MSALWHSGFTLERDHKIKNIQKTSLKIILNDSYKDYETALLLTSLETLRSRGQKHCLSFAKSCLKNQQTANLFPLNPHVPLNLRITEKYKVYFARTQNYKTSTVPYCQRLLNADYIKQEHKRRTREEERRARGREGSPWRREEFLTV